jgi:uncharacterized damage-inducible protein DinB
MESDLIKTFIEYHIVMTNRVWDSIEQITHEQFLADDTYSRGSIRNLMVHLASTDRRWLAGLTNADDVGHLKPEDFPTRFEARQIYEEVAKDLSEYISSVTNHDLNQNLNNISNPRWQILFHMINHGTDHRATVLQRLTEFGAPTFDQDFILWLWGRK